MTLRFDLQQVDPAGGGGAAPPAPPPEALPPDPIIPEQLNEPPPEPGEPAPGGDPPPAGEPPPAAPTLADALAWTDEQGELPAEFANLPLDDIRASQAAAVEAAETGVRTQQAQADRARIVADQRNREVQAAAQNDVDYYEQMLAQRREDPKAFAEQVDDGRYNRGAAAKMQLETQRTQQAGFLSTVNMMARELQAAGVADIIPVQDQTAEGQLAHLQFVQAVQAFDHKGGLAAFILDKGRQLERAEAKEPGGPVAQARVEGQRDARVEQGREGPRDLGQGGGGVSTNSGRFGDLNWVRDQRSRDELWGQRMSGVKVQRGASEQELTNAEAVSWEVAKQRNR